MSRRPCRGRVCLFACEFVAAVGRRPSLCGKKKRVCVGESWDIGDAVGVVATLGAGVVTSSGPVHVDLADLASGWHWKPPRGGSDAVAVGAVVDTGEVVDTGGTLVSGAVLLGRTSGGH